MGGVIMSSVIISGDTSGAITLSAPAVSGTNTATLPAATGTVMVSGNMPAFCVYLSGNQSITSSTWTKINFNTKTFDTANAFDSTTNYRFTPQVAGYYQINSLIGFQSNSLGQVYIRLYKNGSAFKDGLFIANSASGPEINISTIVQANGTTDYFQIYGWQNSGSTLTIQGIYFQASMVRAA